MSKHAFRVLAAVALVGCLALAGVFVVSSRDPSYVGDSRRVTLRWGCFNSISWPQHTTRGHYWWAGDRPVPNGEIETSPPSGEFPSHAARGMLHFVSRSEAVFRSDAGGTLSMQRESSKSFHNMGCALGFA